MVTVRRLIGVSVLVLVAGGTAFAQPTAAGRTLSDRWITAKIRVLYFFTPAITARRIAISTDRGLVTLTGDVGSDEERSKAVAIARDTSGVTNVIDLLTVAKPSHPQGFNDLDRPAVEGYVQTINRFSR